MVMRRAKWTLLGFFVLICQLCSADNTQLLRNGGFESDIGWSLTTQTSYDTQRWRSGKRSLRVHTTQGAQVEQIVYAVAPGEKLTVCGWLATQDVMPLNGSGYAFMAIYQLDAFGRMVQASDFAQYAGTNSWTFASYTFTVNMRAEYLAVRFGIYNAGGTAWFDDLSLVRGERAMDWTEPASAVRPTREYRAAILHEPSLPVLGASTPLQTFRRSLAAEGIPLTPLNTKQLANLATFNADKFDLLIVPTGASFPLAARKALQVFLAQGGDLLTCGGYAFDYLLIQEDGKWVSYAEYTHRQMSRARDRRFALVPDGGFEGGGVGWDTEQRDQCTVVTESPYAGERCGKVTATDTQAGARFSYTLPVEPGGYYLVGAHARTENVQGPGFAFLAVYQYDSAGKLVTFKDFAQIRGSQPWERYEDRFRIDPNATKVVFHAGLYLASGMLWIDELTCAPIPQEERINAHFGEPQDGLIISPTQLTLFSPDQPMSGKRLVPAEGALIGADWSSEGVVEGFEATAQLRQNARWVPLVCAEDEYGRFSGVAGALVHHFAGPFTDSSWAIFGVTNRDIFAGKAGEVLLRRVVRLLRWGIYSETLRSHYATYRRGEVAIIRLEVRNSSAQRQEISVIGRFLSSEGTLLHQRQRKLVAPAKSKRSEEWRWTVPQNAPDFVLLQVDIKRGESVVDRIESGFCVADATVIQGGTRLAFRDNAFELTTPDGVLRRVLLLGTDTYGNWFWSRSHTPLTWFREVRMMRDFGLHLYENLQYHPQQYRFTEAQWRELDAIVQLSQRFGLPYMAGLLIGQDVVVDDATLQRQAEMCRQFAARYRHVPGLIYYLNGDFQLNLIDIPDIRRLWNEFLRERYGTDEALRQAWAPHVPDGKMGDIPVQNVVSGTWYEVRTRDVREFQNLLMCRWIEALCAAIRKEDTQHPITSEYYQRPFGGMDLRLSIGSMQASNIGYFNPPLDDLAQLMATIKWNDMSFAGKTVNLGEFGVKTHDAWTVERGGSHYHIQRTEWQQRQLFWWVVHAALALNVTKIQNWCWTDDPDNVFPWGIVWNNPLRAKPVLKLYRNLRLLTDRVPREYRRAEVVLVLPDNWRLGAPEALAHRSLMNAIECLLATNVPFDVVNEADLPQLRKSTPKAVLMPLAYTLSDGALQTLRELAQAGCMVYLSGDPSTNPFGRRHPERLEQLCGVRLQSVSEHPSGLPEPRVVEVQAKRLNIMNEVPVYYFPQGEGAVFYTPTPWETLPLRDVFVRDVRVTSSPETNLFLILLPMMDIHAPVGVEAPDGIWRAVVAGDDTRRLITVFPRGATRTLTRVKLLVGETELEVEAHQGLPCSALLDATSQVVAATGYGWLRVQGTPIARGESAWMLVSMDAKPLTQSAFLVATSMDGGKFMWHSQTQGLSAWIVDWVNGAARTVAPVPLVRTESGWQIQCQPQELLLICPKDALKDALRHLSFASGKR